MPQRATVTPVPTLRPAVTAVPKGGATKPPTPKPSATPTRQPPPPTATSQRTPTRTATPTPSARSAEREGATSSTKPATSTKTTTPTQTATPTRTPTPPAPTLTPRPAPATSTPEVRQESLRAPTPTGDDSAPGEPTPEPRAAEASPEPIGASPGVGSSVGAVWGQSCQRAFQYWELLERAAWTAGADPQVVGALLVVEGSGERAVSPAGARGLMQLMPDKFRIGDDPFDTPTNLLRAAEHIAKLQARYGAGDRVAAAYFGAIDGAGNVTGASDGNVDGFEYVRRFQAALGCVRSGLGIPGAASGHLVSPLAMPITSANISFGFLEDYGMALATYVRGRHGVARYGTLHLAWDLIVPGAPANGRGYPVFAPMAGRILRTSDPVGGPFGIWLENPSLNLRARLMHMDSLAPNIQTGAWVTAGQWLGLLGAQGTEGIPHLHLSFELLATGERIDPARLYFRAAPQPWPSVGGQPRVEGWPIGMGSLSPTGRIALAQLPFDGVVGEIAPWGSILIWSTHVADDGPLTGYDADLGWTFRIGSPDARARTPAAIFGDTVVWLDGRHAAHVADDRRTPQTVDVYSYDLGNGQERRLTATSDAYSQPVVSERGVAWVRRRGPQSVVEWYDLAADTHAVVARSLGRISNLTMAGPIIAWAESPAASPGAVGSIRAHNLETGQLMLTHQGRVGDPAVVGTKVFWEEQIGAGDERFIRGRDVATGRELTVTPDSAVRRNLRASDGVLLWEERTPDGRAELRLYGVSSGEELVLAAGSSGSVQWASIGHGTAVWRDARHGVKVASLLDWDLVDGHFYVERVAEQTRVGRAGFRITNEDGIPFWSEFRRLGGVALLGRPLSGRFMLDDGLVYQVMEHALLQWRPDLREAVPANTLELLERLGYNDRLRDEWQIPDSIADDGAGDDLGRARAVRLTWMTDPLIRARFFADPVPDQPKAWTVEHAVASYGLPMSEPTELGSLVVQRFQRAVLQRWKPSQPDEPHHESVKLVQVGAIFRQLVLGDTPRRGEVALN